MYLRVYEMLISILKGEVCSNLLKIEGKDRELVLYSGL